MRYYKIADALKATAEAASAPDGLNSIVNLLSLTAPAALKEFRSDQSSPMMQVVMAEIGALRSEFRSALNDRRKSTNEDIRDISLEFELIRNVLREAENLVQDGESDFKKLNRVVKLCEECMTLSQDLLMHSSKPHQIKLRNEIRKSMKDAFALQKKALDLMDLLDQDKES